MKVSTWTIFLLSYVALHSIASYAQCPAGFTFINRLYADSGGAEDSKTHQTTLLPEHFHLDKSYQQSSGTFAGGGSGAASSLTPDQIPAGIHIIPGGSQSGNKGWAVSEPKLEVVKEQDDMVIQRKFTMYMYCTRGSGEADKLQGGCDVRVDVCAKSK
jgi:hypothetical protein